MMMTYDYGGISCVYEKTGVGAWDRDARDVHLSRDGKLARERFCFHMKHMHYLDNLATTSL